MAGLHDYDKILFRLVAILNRLYNNEKLSTDELAKEFNVSTKTISRDIKRLESFHVEKVGKEIVMREGFSLEKVKDVKEQLILDLLENITESFGRDFSSQAKKLLSKIKNRDLTSIYTKIDVEDISKNIDDIFLIEEAINNHNTISFNYEDKKDVLLNPYKIMNFSGYWYLMGYHLKDEYNKKYHLKSMKNITTKDTKFEKPKETDKNIDNAINVWYDEGGTPYEVILEIDAFIIKYFERKKISKTQKLIDKNNETTTISLHITHDMEIIPTILEWMPHIRVISPDFLKEAVKKRVYEYTQMIK